MKKILIFGLVLLVVLVAGCAERGIEQQAVSTKENVLSVVNEISAGEPTGPFKINMSLSEVPTLNKDVEVTITATTFERGNEFPNSSIVFLVERYDPADYNAMYKVRKRLLTHSSILWNGTIRFNETVIIKHVFRIVEPDEYYVVIGGVGVREGVDNVAGFYLNVTEKSARVSKNQPPFVQPPPTPGRPYIIKLDIQGVPKLGSVVELKVTIASLMDQKNATFTIFLPEGFELVSGDLTWTGDLVASTSEEEIRGLMRVDRTFAEEIFSRINIPTQKRVSISTRIKAVKNGDWQIIVLPFKEKPFGVGCNGHELNIQTEKGMGWWNAVSIGGCINVRVLNDTAIVSGLPLPSALPPGATPPPKEFEIQPPATVSPTQLPLSTTLPPQTTSPPPGTPPLPLNATPSG